MRHHRRPIRTLLAYHEAGHAVVGCALGYTAQLVTVRPTPDSYGLCRFDRTSLDSPRHGPLISIAGDVAVELFEPGGRERLCRHAGDFELAPLPPGLPEPLLAVLREPTPCDCGHVVAGLERDPEAALPAGPPRSLSDIARDPLRLREQATRLTHEAADLLEANWLAVEQIADEMLSLGTLQAGRANELFDGARRLRQAGRRATRPRGAA